MRNTTVLSIIALTLMACGGPNQGQQAIQNKKVAEIPISIPGEPAGPITRARMKEILIGKEPDEVLKLIGRPKETYDGGKFGDTWSFKGMTLDTITNKMDMQMSAAKASGGRRFLGTEIDKETAKIAQGRINQQVEGENPSD